MTRIALIKHRIRENGRVRCPERLMPPLSTLYLLGYLRDVAHVDAQVDAYVDPAPSDLAPDYDVLAFDVGPTTWAKTFVSAELACKRNPALYVVAFGAGVWRWQTQMQHVDLMIRGVPHKIMKAVVDGERPKGIVKGDKFEPDLALPKEAYDFKVGALRASHGCVTRCTHCPLPKCKGFGFRQLQHLSDEISRMQASPFINHIEFVDHALFMHPSSNAIFEMLGSGSSGWGASIDCTRKRGQVTQTRKAFASGLRLLRLNAQAVDRATLATLSKRSSAKDIDVFLDRTSALRTKGLKMYASLLYGLPNQTTYSLNKDIVVFLRRGIPVELRQLYLAPGTWLWQQAARLGLRSDLTGAVCETRRMTPKEIELVQLKAAACNMEVEILGIRANACGSET